MKCNEFYVFLECYPKYVHTNILKLKTGKTSCLKHFKLTIQVICEKRDGWSLMSNWKAGKTTARFQSYN